MHFLFKKIFRKFRHFSPTKTLKKNPFFSKFFFFASTTQRKYGTNETTTKIRGTYHKVYAKTDIFDSPSSQTQSAKRT